MKIINRGFICVTPTPLFIAWAAKHSDDNQFFTINPEPSIYLVEDDFWEDSKVIEKYYKKISTQEFNALCTKDEIIPIISSVEEFSLYFDLSLGTIVHDLLKENIERE